MARLQTSSGSVLCAVAYLLLACVYSGSVHGQIPEGVDVPAEVRARMEQAKAMATKGKPDQAKKGEKPNAEKKPGDDKNKEGDKEGEKKEAEATVKRPAKPKKDPDPTELEAVPDGEQLVGFQFHGQPWPAVIEWYSRITGRSIDWRELPADSLYIRTQRKYSLTETGDLLNRHLLARGFTMLEDGEFLMIEKTEGINSALVPRYAPDELHQLMPNSFVKTSFALDLVIAEDAVKDLEQMKSKHGKLTALAASNRIEAMDTAKNLMEIRGVLRAEQESGKGMVEEFELQYVRATDVLKKLESMLGIQQAPTLTPQQIQQMQQQRQRQPQPQNGKQPQPQKKEPEVKLIASEITNSILATAPPRKMAIVRQLVERLDRPSQRSNSLDSFISRNRTYRLTTLNPDMLVKFLMEQGGLDPSTSLTAETKSKMIFASAPLADHLRIMRFIEELDGTERAFKVIRLRRLQADQVATTIEQMMGVKKDDDSRSRRRYYWWDDQQEEDDQAGKFQIAADIENNRLLLKCNDTEYEVVVDLLQQLGEITNPDQMSNQMRVIESVPGESQDDFLQRVKRAFEATGVPNPVILPDPLPIEETEDEEEPIRSGNENREVVVESDSDTLLVQSANPYVTTLTQAPERQDQSPTSRTSRRAEKSPEPIHIERDSQGRLVLRSKDTAALDLLEDLMAEMAPRNAPYEVFTLVYASATWVSLKLEDFFEDDDDSNNRGFFYFYDFDDNQDKSTGLGDRLKLKFISEIDTNTILVRNATPSQLKTIKDLIEIYDVPEPVNSQKARIIKSFRIKHSKARTIETALKELFRDLLSSNDKAFAQKGGDKESESRTRSRGYSFFGGFGDDTSNSDTSTRATFKGKISFGVDESTNILMVTTEGDKLMQIVESHIEELDQAAQPSDDVRVLALPAGMANNSVREALTKMFGPGAVATQGGEPDKKNKEGDQGENGEQRNRRPGRRPGNR